VGVGLGFGIVHVLTGPDHMSALATICANVSPGKAFLLGIQWGIGHSIGLVLVAVLLLAAMAPANEDEEWSDDTDDEIDVPENISNILESFVGIFMILLGLFGCWSAFRKKSKQQQGMGEFEDDIYMEKNENSLGEHATKPAESITPFSTIYDEEEEVIVSPGGSPASCSTRTFITICIGIVHGVAGPGGVLGVLPAVSLHNWSLAMIYLMSFCVSSTFTMGTFAALYGVCSTRLGYSISMLGKNGVFYVELFSAFLSILVGILWLILISLGILDDIFP